MPIPTFDMLMSWCSGFVSFSATGVRRGACPQRCLLRPLPEMFGSKRDMAQASFEQAAPATVYRPAPRAKRLGRQRSFFACYGRRTEA